MSERGKLVVLVFLLGETKGTKSDLALEAKHVDLLSGMMRTWWVLMNTRWSGKDDGLSKLKDVNNVVTFQELCVGLVA